MKQRTIYLINAGVCLLFALGLLLMPSVMLNLFGMNDTEQAVMLGQLISVELVVGGVITGAAVVATLVVRRAMELPCALLGLVGFGISAFAFAEIFQNSLFAFYVNFLHTLLKMKRYPKCFGCIQ